MLKWFVFILMPALCLALLSGKVVRAEQYPAVEKDGTADSIGADEDLGDKPLVLDTFPVRGIPPEDKRELERESERIQMQFEEKDD